MADTVTLGGTKGTRLFSLPRTGSERFRSEEHSIRLIGANRDPWLDGQTSE